MHGGTQALLLLPLDTEHTALSALLHVPSRPGYCLTSVACTAVTAERICPSCTALGLFFPHLQHTTAGCRGAIGAAVKSLQHPPATQQQQLLLLCFHLWRLQASSGIHSCVDVQPVARQATSALLKALQDANHPLPYSHSIQIHAESPCYALQVVAFQAMMEMMADKFPGAFSGYSLQVQESHQRTKADTSGTAKAVVASFQKLGLDFTEVCMLASAFGRNLAMGTWMLQDVHKEVCLVPSRHPAHVLQAVHNRSLLGPWQDAVCCTQREAQQLELTGSNLVSKQPA